MSALWVGIYIGEYEVVKKVNDGCTVVVRWLYSSYTMVEQSQLFI